MIESQFPRHLVGAAIDAALMEDLGLAGDITGNAVIAPNETMVAAIVARRAGVIAGLPLARTAFAAIDAGLAIEPVRFDGETVNSGDAVLRVAGNSRAILAAERVALNYLGHLSGIATETARYVGRIEGTGAAICCTRKTLPGLRAFQKYAVRAGGGQNHRFGLDDAVLVKDNHIASAGGVDAVLQRVRAHVGHMVKVEIEVDTLDQLREVLRHKVDAVLLDNMSLEDMKTAVGLVAGRCVVEASGGVTLDRVRDIALTGVDLISVGALTHSASVLDLGLDIA
jgi:nicotinate-nucleotide pyrophosphorylase (carboxylating)